MNSDKITNVTVFTEDDLKEDVRNQKRFNKKMRRELLKSEERRRKNELTEIKKSNKLRSERSQKFTTTKILMYFIILNCSIVEIYSMVVMYRLADLSALYTLIGAVVSESISYAIYCAKSFNDSKEEAKSKLERDKFELGLTASSDITNIDMSNVVEDPIPEDDDHSGDIPEDVVMEEGEN